MLTALALAGCGGSPSVELPSNHGHTLDDALRRLHDAGLRASFPAARTPCGEGLPWVNVQSPRAPARVDKGSVVTLKFGYSPIPSPTVPLVRPKWTYVPDLLGKDVASASTLRAIWPCVHVRAATDTSASHLVIVEQRPAPHTRVPAYGVRVGRGWRPTRMDLYLAAKD